MDRESTEGCYFDTLNTMTYDTLRGKYVAFVRGFHKGDDYNLEKEEVDTALRDIRYTESTDLVNWSTPVPLNYGDDDTTQMYANAISQYERAPQLYIGLPTRLTVINGSFKTDTMFMSSRDLVDWNRYSDVYIDPGPNWEYGDCYPSVGFVETATGDSDVPTELSFYMKERSGRPILYRYSLRLDGFVSENGKNGETLFTKPVVMNGSSLFVNYKAAEGGSMTVTISDGDGNSITSEPMTGNSTDAAVSFGSADLTVFEGKTVSISFTLNNAELYSFLLDK